MRRAFRIVRSGRKYCGGHRGRATTASFVGARREVDDESRATSPVELRLTLVDPDLCEALGDFGEDHDARDAFATRALKIGVDALTRAHRHAAADNIKEEGQRIADVLRERFEDHERTLHSKVNDLLRVYFDPSDGQFNQRIERLVRKDGDLEVALRRHIGDDDASELGRSLARHLGEQSPLMRQLSSSDANGLTNRLSSSMDTLLTEQRERILQQFSLDRRDSALSRFLRELGDRHDIASRKMGDRHDVASEQLRKEIRNVVKEFSLDEESSALSRLVRNVETAQSTIRKDFREFQTEVTSTLRAMDARREEEKKSTRHGMNFENQMMDVIHRIACDRGDVAESTGGAVGAVRRCKVGDAVISLGPESAAPGARIVLEAKQDKRYTLAMALDEMRRARENREAQIGIFVWSKRTAPDSVDEVVCRYGDDIVVQWDSEDPASDLYLDVGVSLARALCVRRKHASDAERSDADGLVSIVAEIDRCVPELERQTQQLDQVETWASTIKTNAEKILRRVDSTRRGILGQLESLQASTRGVRR